MLIKEIRFKDGTLCNNVVTENFGEFKGFLHIVFVHDTKEFKAGTIIHFNKNSIDHIILK